VGGTLVTKDIARGLSTSLADAERIKTLYGSVSASPSDDREVIKVPLIGEEDEREIQQVPRSMLVGIIRPRLEETFELVRARLEAAGFDKVAGRRVMLTGGASQLPGARELAGLVLEKQVRLGRPRPIEGLAEAASGPAFATCVGLLNHTVNNRAEASFGAYRPVEEPNGRFGRLGHWLRGNF
jgi:cell division protein FtsA